ncbi:ribonuclease H-like domain-containing protein [Tanacetum coccineum]
MRTLESDGIAGLYRGFGPSCVGIALYRSLYSGLYESLKPVVLTGKLKDNTSASFALASGVSFIAGLTSYPLDTASWRMMITSTEAFEFKHSWHALNYFMKKEGAKSLYKGASVNILRAIAGGGVLLSRSSNLSLWLSSATGIGFNVQGINNQELLVCLLGQLGFTTPTNVAQSTGSSAVTLPSANMVNPIVYHTHASLVPNFVVGTPGFNAGPVGYSGPSLVYHTTQVQPVYYRTLSHNKARIVANGSTQVTGIDVDETFSPVVKPGTIWTVLSLAASRHWLIHQLDVNNAFLHGDLSKTVYMHQPLGFHDSAHPDYVCLLERSLYGLKQAFQAWFQRFVSYITRVGFHHSRCDSSLFIYRKGTYTSYLLLYVDDIVLTASSETLLQQIIRMFLSRRKYAIEILEMGHMVNCNPNRTPVDTESKVGYDGDPVFGLTLYRSLVGSLQYLTFTRLDISYAVQQVCLYMHDPREPHFLALKRILQYVRGTLDYGLQLFSSSTTYLVAYSDADWAGCLLLGDRLQVIVAEAKYRGVANAVAETCWLRNLLRELHTPLSSATLVYCDNVRVLHVPSRYQYADIFTKVLPSTLFEEFRTSLSVRCPTAPTDVATWLDEIKLGGYCLTFKENGVNRECLKGLEKLPNDIGVYKSIDGSTEVTLEVSEMHVVDGKIVAPSFTAPHEMSPQKTINVDKHHSRKEYVLLINVLRRLLTTPNIGTSARLLLMPKVVVYTCINDNLNAIVKNCAQDSPYSNKLQSLNAAFPLGVVTPTTSIEASSSVAEDAITELPHTEHKVVYKHKHTSKDCILFQDLDCVFPWNHF